MKRLLAVLLACFGTSAAVAAPPCWPDLGSPVQLRMGTIDDRPALGQVIYATSTVGLVWGYACTTPDNKWHRVIAGGPWTAFPSDWAHILDTALRGTAADRAALWDKYATASAWDPRLQPMLDGIWARLPLPPPVTEWKVLADPFRADKKRLVYSVVNGRRGPNIGQYVDAGAPCDPVTTIMEFGPVYFLSVGGNPNTVARCTK